ncbi:uncharacterized protein LOC108910057 [Anoplophora glabripennis]|uniref:uncharacterized protein LOC108910057 n=1 Tax=Anoplophora glabripennis TaxID=217634 RepID=UPI000873ABB1|nr:uncharacterized protein LOC108910057 [Anoplophora glabripennis]
MTKQKMVLIAFIVALALAPGLMSTTVQAGELSSIQNFPGVYVPPSLLPPEAVHPQPEEEPEAEAVVTNPCNACFEYMTDLIDQLTETVVIPEIEAHPMPEIGVLPIPNPGATVPVGPRPIGPLA